MTQLHDRIEQNCGWATVVEYINATNITVQFDDGTTVRTEAGQFRKGSVKNYNAPSICGVGVIGYGIYSRKTHPSLYGCWHNVIRYCYSSTARDTVDPRWHNFQHFCEDLVNTLNYRETKASCLQLLVGLGNNLKKSLAYSIRYVIIIF
jgi:hypothetical protein